MPRSAVSGVNTFVSATDSAAANLTGASNHSYLAYDAEVSSLESTRAAISMEIDYLLCQPPKFPASSYRSWFAELNSPFPPPHPPDPPHQPLPPRPPPRTSVHVDCGDCWHVNSGEDGDCSSMPGCGSWMCDFCTNSEGVHNDD